MYLIYLLSEYWILLLAAIIVGGLAYYFYHKNSTENARPVPDDERLHLTGKSSSDDPMYPSNYLFEFWPKDVHFFFCFSWAVGTCQKRKSWGKIHQQLWCGLYKRFNWKYLQNLSAFLHMQRLWKQQKILAKHILKLALHTGALEEEDQLFGIPEEIEQRLQSITKKARRVFMNYCNGDALERVITVPLILINF